MRMQSRSLIRIKSVFESFITMNGLFAFIISFMKFLLLLSYFVELLSKNVLTLDRSLFWMPLRPMLTAWLYASTKTLAKGSVKSSSVKFLMFRDSSCLKNTCDNSSSCWLWRLVSSRIIFAGLTSSSLYEGWALPPRAYLTVPAGDRMLSRKLSMA